MTNEFYYDVEFFKTKYIMIQRQKFKVSIEKKYSEYIKIADDLKLNSNGIRRQHENKFLSSQGTGEKRVEKIF